MAEMFGAPIGISQATSDIAKMAMTNAQVQHLGVQDLMAPSTAQQRSAQARWLNARSSGKEAEALVEQRVAEMAARGSVASSNGEPTNIAREVAKMYLSAGNPDKAMKAENIAASIDQKGASASANAAREQLIAARTVVSRAGNLASQMTMVDSPEALQTALHSHAEATGEDTTLLDASGNLLPQYAADWEGTRDKIKDMALTQRDRALASYREKALQSADKERKSKQETRDFWRDMGNQEERARRQALGRGKKAGALGPLDKIDPKLGTDYIGSQLEVDAPEQGKVLGRKLAERAQQARELNPALTPTEATKAAFDAMDTAGEFTGMRKRPPGAADSVKRPLTLPADGDKSKLKQGFWYSDGTSKRQWLGNRWSAPEHSRGKIGERSAYVPPAAPEDMGSDTSDEEDDALAMED